MEQFSRLRVGVVLAALTLAMMVSGCTGQAPGEASSGASDGPLAGGTGTAPGPGVRPLVLPGTPGETIHWWNGSFAGYQNQYTVGDVTEEVGVDAEAQHRRDVSEHLPTGTLLRVTVEIEADLAEGDVDVWLDLPDEVPRNVRADAPYGGWTRVEYALVRPSPDAVVTLVVQHDEMEPVPSFDYSVRMTVAVENEWVPDGIPALVTLADADVIEVFAEGASEGGVLVWGPSGAFLGNRTPEEGVVRIAASDLEGAGTYAVARVPGDGRVRLLLDGPGPGPVALPGLRWERGEEQSGPGRLSWTVTAPAAPLVAGLWFRIEAAYTGPVAATVKGPTGELLRLEDDAGLTVGWTYARSTAFGDPGLRAGEYTFEVDPAGTMAPTDPVRAFDVFAYIGVPR